MDFSRMMGGGLDYQLEPDSDSEAGESSSEDEIEQFLHGTPEQKRRIRRRSLGKDSSSGDEFEKEMDVQLNATMKDIQQASGTPLTQDGKATGFYDDIYFDSDSDENEKSEEKKHKRHRVLSNDELLYNPNEDEENQQWVNAQRIGNQQRSKGKRSTRTAPSSDAILNCPACMTTLCVDCQRHDLYKHQYRAMFVMNCTTDKEEVLKYPKANLSKKNRRKRKHKDNADSSTSNSGQMSVNNQESDQPPPTKMSHDHMDEQVVSHDPAISHDQSRNAAVSHGPSQNASVSHEPSQNASVVHGPSHNSPESQATTQNASVLQEPSQDASGEDLYHPVRCTECKTEVGVCDNEEIFHFYNVLASYA